ncbi:unnamed protein product [Leuciscus chuanchicus]
MVEDLWGKFEVKTVAADSLGRNVRLQPIPAHEEEERIHHGLAEGVLGQRCRTEASHRAWHLLERTGVETAQHTPQLALREAARTECTLSSSTPYFI